MRERVYIYVDGAMRPAWRDLGPGYAATGHHTGALVVGVSSKTLEQIRDAKKRETRAEASIRRRAAAVVYPEPGRPICGASLPLAGGTCARRPGHRDSHRSRLAMDDDAKRRRTAA